MKTSDARSRNPGPAAKRVLIIKLSALGDLVLALGAIQAVRQFHPHAQITLLTTPPFKTFMDACPFVDKVETDGRPDGVRATREMLKRLSAAKYDVVYDFQTSSGGRTNNYFRALRPKPLWSGIAPGCAFLHDTPHRGELHTIERLGEQLALAGVTRAGGASYVGTPPMPDLSWIPAALGAPPRLKPEYFGLTAPYMLLIPGASAHRTAKRWPLEQYTRLASQLADAGITPAIIGAKAEADLAQSLQRAEGRVKNLVTRTDLFQISTLAASAAFVVGNDTGPMHLATLSGAPGVALFATNESSIEKARPRGSHVTVIHGPTLEYVRAVGTEGASGVFDILRCMGLIDGASGTRSDGRVAVAV